MPAVGRVSAAEACPAEQGAIDHGGPGAADPGRRDGDRDMASDSGDPGAGAGRPWPREGDRGAGQGSRRGKGLTAERAACPGAGVARPAKVLRCPGQPGEPGLASRHSGTDARAAGGAASRVDEVDLRTFEWYYLWKQCHPGRRGIGGPGRGRSCRSRSHPMAVCSRSAAWRTSSCGTQSPGRSERYSSRGTRCASASRRTASHSWSAAGHRRSRGPGFGISPPVAISASYQVSTIPHQWTG